MIKIDKELIERVADLAKLNLNEDEKEKYKADLEEILKAFSILDEISVDKIEPSIRPVEGFSEIREDEPKESISQEKALKFTQNKEKGFFVGPKTIE